MSMSPTKVLAAPMSPPLSKSPPPNRRTPFHLDDPQYDGVRVPQFKELQSYELALAKHGAEADKARRKEAAALFKARQETRLVEEGADKERAAALRKDALEKMRWDAEGFQTKEPGYGPMRWTSTVATNNPRMWATAHDVLIPPPPGMYSVSGAPDAFGSYTATIDAHEATMRMSRLATKEAEDAANAAVEDKKKLEAEAEAAERQKGMLAKAEAAEKAAAARSKQIKKEMAEETRKQKVTVHWKRTQKNCNGALTSPNALTCKPHPHPGIRGEEEGGSAQGLPDAAPGIGLMRFNLPGRHPTCANGWWTSRNRNPKLSCPSVQANEAYAKAHGYWN